MLLTCLSVVIITKNAAHLLPKCLASVSSWVNEIIILDSGSDDGTVTLAKTLGAKVFINCDWQGYGVQRQRAQSFATNDYILMLDADEIVTSALKEEINSVLMVSNFKIVYSIARRNFFIGRFMRYSGWYPDYVIRLYARKYYQYNNNAVHESLSYNDAQVIKLNNHLLHIACYDFANFQHKQISYAASKAVDYYQSGKKVLIISIFIRTLMTFFKILFLRGGIFDGKRGWLLAFIHAQYTFNKYVSLWSLNHYNCSEKL